jgi:hypothetical protein
MRDEGSIVFASVGNALAGAFVFDDSIRPDAPRVLRLLKRLGIEESVMLTGDHVTVAEPVGAAIGVDRVLADLTPEEKVSAVRQSRSNRVTIMVGDGINDAPALAARTSGSPWAPRRPPPRKPPMSPVVDRLDRLVEPWRSRMLDRRHPEHVDRHGPVIRRDGAPCSDCSPVLGAVAQEAIDAAAISMPFALRSAGTAIQGCPPTSLRPCAASIGC